jgi:alkylhydroperoxidase family enzyme
MNQAMIETEKARQRVARGLKVAGERARNVGAKTAATIQALRRTTMQFSSAAQEWRAKLRRAWKKATRRSAAQAVVPLFCGPDFMESLFQRSIDPKLHAILQLRTAVRLGCDGTADARSEACLLHGWAPELIRAAQNGSSNLAFSEQENLLLRYADDITRTPIDVDLQVFRELRRHFTPDQIVEITAAICYENFRTRFRNALGVERSTREEHSTETESAGAVAN